MKTFIKKHLATLVTTPVFTFYILFLPAKNEAPKLQESIPEIHKTDSQLKNTAFISDIDPEDTRNWIFKFRNEQ